jgi:hypothetical protein
LLLTAIGAILGTLSQTLADHGTKGGSWSSAPAILGLVSGIIIALATFFTKEILSPERDRRWVRARSMAEALKSETYLFRAGVTPYDVPDAAEHLLDRTKDLLAKVSDVQAATLSAEQQRERLPSSPLSVNDYITERIDDQINNFYVPRARQYEALLARTRGISLGLGAVATVLGVIGMTGWTAGWVAVITTITTAIAAYLYAGRSST